jgi:predicted glycoside hydrolase/deacetylase ChbG (UPF0249 family)
MLQKRIKGGLMGPNPALKKLGFSDTDRVVLVHTDDIGMCQASVTAFADLWEAGGISCGAAMVPCAWFNAAADYCRLHPEVDMGVHATLTSEWQPYRWGPLTSADLEHGLTDAEAKFHKTSEAVAELADPAAVKVELAAQIAHAKAAGIEPTHIDTHMGSVMHGPLYDVFVDLALEHGIPPFALRLTADQWSRGGYSAESCATFSRRITELESAGVPTLDRILNVPLSDEEDRAGKTKSALSSIKPGHISYFIIHPSHDTPELRGICPDWRSRVMDLEMFLSGEMAEHLAKENIHLIGYRALKELIPQGLAA